MRLTWAAVQAVGRSLSKASRWGGDIGQIAVAFLQKKRPNNSFYSKFLYPLCIFATVLVLVVANRVVFAIYLLPEISFSYS